jgi:hypothetical protein
VLLNQGGGRLAPKVDYPGGGQVAAGDLDGDGKPDLAIANGAGVAVRLNQGNGTFAAAVDYATGPSSTWVAIGDLDGDGKADLAVTCDGGLGYGLVSVLLNRGAGTFAAHVDHPLDVGGIASRIAMADLDGDQQLDLVLAFHIEVGVLLNRGAGTFAPEVDYATGDIGSLAAVAVADLDGDGRNDLAVANPISVQSSNLSSVSVLLNQGAGAFAAPVDYPVGNDNGYMDLAGSPASIAVGDLDGDGRIDLANANAGDDTVSVLLNRGSGRFDPSFESFPASGTTVAAGDFDGDGRLDFVVAGSTSGVATLEVFLDQGGGSFTTKTSFANMASGMVSAGDLDGDGRADLVFAGGSGVDVALATGAGAFAAPVHYSAPNPLDPTTSPAAIGDVDGDGKPDLVANGLDVVTVYLNRGAGTFAAGVDFPTPAGPIGVAALGDLDGDGRTDIAVARDAQGPAGQVDVVSVLFNQGGGAFAPYVNLPAGPSPQFLVAGDLDGDGDLDLAVANQAQVGVNATQPPEVDVLLNRGNGTFAAPVAHPIAAEPWGLLLGDLDGDNQPDLIVGKFDNALTVLLNQGAGTFTAPIDYPTPLAPVSFAAGDLDGDHKLDLVVAGDFDQVSVLLNRCW